MLSRRNVLKSSAAVPALAVGGITGQLVTCGPNGVQINPEILNAIQQAVAAGCNFIPAVTMIVALIGASFPALVGATTITDTVLQQISALLCASAPTPAAGKSMISGTNIPVNGWIIQNGKLVYI